MSTITSTLALKVDDDGLIGKLKADAAALKNFGASAGKIRATAGGADLLKQFERLQATAGKLDGFSAATRGLEGLGARLRTARSEVEKTARAMAAADRKVQFFEASKARGSHNYSTFVGSGAVAEAAANLKATRRQHAVAVKTAAGIEDAFGRQKIAVRAAGAEIERTGTPLAALAQAQHKAKADIEAVTVAIRRQVAAHEQSSAAAVASRVEMERAAPIQLRAAVAAGRQARADHIAAVERDRARRASAGSDMTRGMGAFGSRQAAAIEGGRRLRDGMSAPARAARDRAAAETHAEGLAHAAEERERDRHIRRHGALNAAGAGAAGYVSAHSIGHGITDTIKAGARYQHEVVGLQNAGRTPAEMHEIEEASRATSRALPTASYEENLKVVNETTGAFGTLHHAIENLPFMQKSNAVLKAAAGDKIHGSAGDLGNKLARFFEERQVAGDTATFQREAEGLVRAMAFTRGNFNPDEAMNFAQQAKTALPGYSERFLTKVAPSLITMMKGDRAGTAANAFKSVITGKVNDRKQAEEWLRYGLLDKGKTEMKAGHAVGWRAGAVKGTDLALSDPLEWAEKVALPAMREKGVNTENRAELTKALATMFRNNNSNMFADAIMQTASRSRLHKDEDNIGRAGTLDEIYKRNLASDPTASMAALSASLDNLMTTASSPAMQAAAKGITALSGGLQTLSDAAVDHPNLAMGGGAALAGGALAGTGWLTYQLATGFGLGTSATALTASAAALDGAAATLAGKGTASTAATAATAAGGAAGGAGLSFGLGGVAVAAGALYGAVADALTPGTNGGLWGAITGQESSLAQTMRVLREEREKGRGTFEGRGSLPPGAAGAPQAPQARLPGLDGRQSQIPATVAPKVDTSSIEGVGPKADTAKAAVEGLNLTAKPTVDVGSIASAQAAADRLVATLQSIGGLASSAAASANNAIGGIRARAQAGASFSDGVTAGP